GAAVEPSRDGAVPRRGFQRDRPPPALLPRARGARGRHRDGDRTAVGRGYAPDTPRTPLHARLHANPHRIEHGRRWKTEADGGVAPTYAGGFRIVRVVAWAPCDAGFQNAGSRQAISPSMTVSRLFVAGSASTGMSSSRTSCESTARSAT